MTPNKQLSPVIRISRGERDASARATHLEAAFEKYSKTTIERKQMSTTTNFKRIALVAVAALGLGVLTSVPSSAAINSDTLTLSATTAAQNTAETATATSAIVTFSFVPTVTGDSVTLNASLVSGPGGSALPYLRLVETTSAQVGTNDSRTASALLSGTNPNTNALIYGTAGTQGTVKFRVYLAQGGSEAAPTTVGTYVVKVTPAAVTGSGALQAAAAVTLTITVTAAAALDKKAATTSTVYLQGTGGNATNAAYDSTVAAAKTASATSVGFVTILQKNAAGGSAAEESITVTTNIGTLQLTDGTNLGRSLLVAADGSATKEVFIAPDGNAGKATITVTTASGVLLGTKTVTFFDSVSTLSGASIAATDTSVIAVAGTTTVSVAAKDKDGNVVSNLVGGTSIFAISSDTTLATVATVGSYDATTGTYPVVVTGVAVGSPTITFANASTLAAATIKSNAATVRVGSGTAANVKVTLDKATYAPGEKATLTVTVVDSTDKAVVGGDKAAIFATGGITSSVQLGSGSDTISGTSVLVSGVTNTKTYTLYMPSSGGAVKFSWTGGTGLATANQVAGSVSTTVTDNGAAALAAVTALATTVASLRTLIVTLTNLVLKIQKKVKA